MIDLGSRFAIFLYFVFWPPGGFFICRPFILRRIYGFAGCEQSISPETRPVKKRIVRQDFNMTVIAFKKTICYNGPKCKMWVFTAENASF